MMADYGSSQSLRNNYKHSVLGSPKLFANLVSKSSLDTDNLTMSSPTSILDSIPFSPLKASTPRQENKSPWERLDSRGLVDALIDEKPDPNLSKMVIFGSQLKIQVPPLPPPVSVSSPSESPRSPGDFGIKTRSSHVSSFSLVKKSPFSSLSSLSASEMELSEDYTCVISYGPIPRTTHIFDDCIVESCCGVMKFSELRNENGCLPGRSTGYPSESFLSCCYGCKKNLGQGKDIYMYRGEKGFCSRECRYEEMVLEDDPMDTSESNHMYGTSS